MVTDLLRCWRYKRIYIDAQLCKQLSPQKQFSRQQLQKGPEINMRGRWLQAPGDISGYIQDMVMGLEDPFSLTG